MSVTSWLRQSIDYAMTWLLLAWVASWLVLQALRQTTDSLLSTVLATTTTTTTVATIPTTTTTTTAVATIPTTLADVATTTTASTQHTSIAGTLFSWILGMIEGITSLVSGMFYYLHHLVKRIFHDTLVEIIYAIYLNGPSL